MGTQNGLFGDLRPKRPRSHPPKEPLSIEAPLWTADKSRLIDEYIHLFLVVTKHGVYLDLFAGPQRASDTTNWSVRRVLDRRSVGNPAIHHYAVCDSDSRKAQRLRDLGQRHPSFCVYEGDVNRLVNVMLEDAPITPKTACFCLIDQRTFECQWATVEAVARHKAEGRKVEVFYFLAQRWFDRAWDSTKDKSKLAAWWGREDYESFRPLSSFARAQALCRRFRDDLGYAYSMPFAIYQKGKGSPVMYYMIHASDHANACHLMSEAYLKAQATRTEIARPLPFRGPATDFRRGGSGSSGRAGVSRGSAPPFP